MKPHIPLLLGIIMFGMGATLTLVDFQRVFQRPVLLLVGVALQYGIMPLLGFGIAFLFDMPSALLAGFVLLGACPGGTASNVITYLARGNVGLSVSLTLFSTALAALFTPWLTWIYAHQQVEVPVLQLMKNTISIVLLPLVGGLILRWFLQRRIQPVLQYFPVLSVAIILAVIACVVALNADNIQQMSVLVGAGVILHNAGGLFLGYSAAHCLNCTEAEKRTLAIEVGMQNSGLATALALESFGTLAALPGALFSLWHNVTGSILATVWSRQSAKESPHQDDEG